MRILFTSPRRRGGFRILWTPAEERVGRIAGRVGRRIVSDDVPGRAAQLSYYFLLSLFPLLVFLFALVGSVFRAEVELEAKALAHLRDVMPSAAYEVVTATTADLAKGGSSGKLSFGLLLALWLASSGMEAVIEGLNVAYRVSEWRPWWRRRVLALALTLGMAAAILGSLGLILLGGRIGEGITAGLRLGLTFQAFWGVARWAAALILLLSSIALLYKLAPNLSNNRPGVLLPGAFVALTGWFAASSLLRWYLSSFSTLGATYGSLAAVIALMIWLYLTGAVLLVGGIVNSEICLEIGEPIQSGNFKGGS